MPDSAGSDLVQGNEGSPSPPPGNPHGAEQFPEFCLHRDDFHSGFIIRYHSLSSPSTPTASSTTSPLSSRSSTLSTVSTSSGVLSFPPSPEAESKHHLQHHLQHRHQQRHQPHQDEDRQDHPWATSTSPTPRTRRDKKALHAARVQRSASNSIASVAPLGIKNTRHHLATKARRFHRSASSPADALAALEPPHDQGLTRMAFAEQQRWITVQQKTFTKWYAVAPAPALDVGVFFFFLADDAPYAGLIPR